MTPRTDPNLFFPFDFPNDIDKVEMRCSLAISLTLRGPRRDVLSIKPEILSTEGEKGPCKKSQELSLLTTIRISAIS
jgi:hypothetical protein